MDISLEQIVTMYNVIIENRDIWDDATLNNIIVALSKQLPSEIFYNDAGKYVFDNGSYYEEIKEGNLFYERTSVILTLIQIRDCM
jgi:hypothetical protein